MQNIIFENEIYLQLHIKDLPFFEKKARGNSEMAYYSTVSGPKGEGVVVLLFCIGCAKYQEKEASASTKSM